MNFDELIHNVTNWAHKRSLISDANVKPQTLKVMEELGETCRAILKSDQDGIRDGLGDTFVTLIILCEQLGYSPKECLESAWEEIKDREGKTVNGTFIKN